MAVPACGLSKLIEGYDFLAGGAPVLLVELGPEYFCIGCITNVCIHCSTVICFPCRHYLIVPPQQQRIAYSKAAISMQLSLVPKYRLLTSCERADKAVQRMEHQSVDRQAPSTARSGTRLLHRIRLCVLLHRRGHELAQTPTSIWLYLLRFVGQGGLPAVGSAYLRYLARTAHSLARNAPVAKEQYPMRQLC